MCRATQSDTDKAIISLFATKMSEMIDKVFSTKLGEQMTGFYGKQKMLRKLNNKLEMNNQQQKVVELD